MLIFIYRKIILYMNTLMYSCEFFRFEAALFIWAFLTRFVYYETLVATLKTYGIKVFLQY
jgi:hypothetical protein